MHQVRSTRDGVDLVKHLLDLERDVERDLCGPLYVRSRLLAGSPPGENSPHVRIADTVHEYLTILID